MLKVISLALLIVLVSFGLTCTEKDTEPPRVVSTVPQNGDQNVDPALKKISVTFNEEMMDGNWSWVYENKDDFPQITGQAYYTDNYTKNVLPVKLKPNKKYVIWINSKKFKNFKDKSGNSAYPFKFTFTTKSAE